MKWHQGRYVIGGIEATTVEQLVKTLINEATAADRAPAVEELSRHVNSSELMQIARAILKSAAPPSAPAFTDEDRWQLVEQALSADKLSDFSKLVAIGSIALAREPLTEQDIARTRELAERFGWVQASQTPAANVGALLATAGGENPSVPNGGDSGVTQDEEKWLDQVGDPVAQSAAPPSGPAERTTNE